jgi:hypothetical protein
MSTDARSTVRPGPTAATAGRALHPPPLDELPVQRLGQLVPSRALASPPTPLLGRPGTIKHNFGMAS